MLLARRRGWIPLLFDLTRNYGDLVHFTMGGENVFLINHPDLIKDVLILNSHKFAKGGTARIRRLFGEGLLTSDGEEHRRQRALLQPSFHRQKIQTFGDLIAGCTEEMMARWEPGSRINVYTEMRELALVIAARVLFSSDVRHEAAELAGALDTAGRLLDAAQNPFADFLLRLPGRRRRLEHARGRLRDSVEAIIARRRAAASRPDDVLTVLLAEQESAGELTDEQIRDQCLTLLVAGHETSANALAWTWFLLGTNPEARFRLHEEVDRFPRPHRFVAADYPALKFVEQSFSEAMRLYPPAWVLDRRAIEPHVLGGFAVPAGSIIMISPFVLHRDPRFYRDPEAFVPERWKLEEQASRPKFSYLPFGAGPRSCIGEGLAWMEGVLIVAAVARRFDLQLDPGHRVEMLPTIVLRQKGGVVATVIER
jgi:cytochrome P450